MDANVAQLKRNNNKCYVSTFRYIYIDVWTLKQIDNLTYWINCIISEKSTRGKWYLNLNSYEFVFKQKPQSNFLKHQWKIS